MDYMSTHISKDNIVKLRTRMISGNDRHHMKNQPIIMFITYFLGCIL